MPRALPGLGEDSIRSKLLKRIAVDLGQNFKSAMRDPKSHQGAVKALDQLNLDVQDTVEPLRFSQIHHLTQSVYMALMIWFVMNPTPELVFERTQLSALTSSVAYMGIYSGLIYLRRVTSGMGFAAAIRHIMKKAGVSSYERKATVHGIVDFLSGRPCSSSVSRIKNRWE